MRENKNRKDKRGLWLKTLTEQLSAGVDQEGLRSLRSLITKYTRDYLQFFQGISSRYQKGEIKEQADNAVDATRRILDVLSKIEASRVVSKEDEKEVPELSEVLFQYKEFFSSEQKRNRSFQSKLEEISRKEGVRLKDLNVSSEISAQVLQETRKATKESIFPSAEKFTESRWGLGRGLQTAVLGPFSPLLDISKTLLKDLGRFGSDVRKRYHKRKTSQIIKNLIPSGQEVQQSGQQGVIPGDVVPQVSGRPVPSEKPLMDFFDRGAYRARWTKELLETTKKNAKTEVGGFGSALGLTGLLSAGPLLVGGATAILAVEKVFGQAQEDLAKRYDSLGERLDVALALAKKVAEKRSELSKDIESSMQIVAPLMKDIGDLQILPQDLKRDPFALQIPGLQNFKLEEQPEQVRVEPFDQRLLGLEQQLGQMKASPQKSVASPAPELKVVVPGLEDIGKKIQESIDQMKQSLQVPQPGPRLVNVHDSGDILTREYAKGNLTIGD